MKVMFTGVRRSGKSELMKDFASELEERDPLPGNIYIGLLDLDNESLPEYHALRGKVKES